jgi:hypothetical protein
MTRGFSGGVAIDGATTRTVTLRDYNTARADVPEAARKALE